MERLTEQVKIYWIIKSLISGSIFGIIAGAGLQIAFGMVALSVAPTVLFPIVFALYSLYRYRYWGFELREEYLFVKYGVITKVRMKIPYIRVQHVDTNRGPIERSLGLSSLRVYTAGSRGADIRIPGLNRSRAEELQKELKDRAIESEKGFDAV